MDQAAANGAELLTGCRVTELEICGGAVTAVNADITAADATILPEAMGNPPILTIMALAKKIAAVTR